MNRNGVRNTCKSPKVYVLQGQKDGSDPMLEVEDKMEGNSGRE